MLVLLIPANFSNAGNPAYRSGGRRRRRPARDNGEPNADRRAFNHTRRHAAPCADAGPADRLRVVVVDRLAKFYGVWRVVLADKFVNLRQRLIGSLPLASDKAAHVLDRSVWASVSAAGPRFHRVQPDCQKIGGLPVREAADLEQERKGRGHRLVRN